MSTCVLVLPNRKRLAVGRRARHFGRADHAAAAALVLDHDGAELGLHPLGPQPADHVGRAARRERHDQPDRPVGIGRTPGCGSAAAASEASPHLMNVASIHDSSSCQDCDVPFSIC